MCMFPRAASGLAVKYGIKEFECGACPECLRKRSNVWALRAVYESKDHAYNCMVTLTYDSFMRDSKGEIMRDKRGRALENPVDPDLKVNRRDIQLFIKRLRKKYGQGIKYIACAEYGSRTHRAHYHLILFGVRFEDAHFYKRSKRGNPIFMSALLSELWNHGIATIDSTNVYSAIARYCTKYCAKSRSDDTFMLCSHFIGFEALKRDFNGINYMIDGREYIIPKMVWQWYISNKYNGESFDYRYVNKTDQSIADGSYDRACLLRINYRDIRDADPIYQRYVDYWHHRAELFDSRRLSARSRILQLQDSKFHAYKERALMVLDHNDKYGYDIPAPDSNVGVKELIKKHYKRFPITEFSKLRYINQIYAITGESFAEKSRPNTANDTKCKKNCETVLTFLEFSSIMSIGDRLLEDCIEVYVPKNRYSEVF